MSPQQVIEETQKKINSALKHFEEELKKLRTGRASASMLDSVVVQAYGTPMPLNQLATITVPEAQLLQISPFDPTNLQAISAAIRDNQSLGMNPADDGRVVRVPVPPLNEERRREISKQVGAKFEEFSISLRNLRHEALDTFDQAKKDKDISEDESKRLNQKVEEIINKSKSEAELISERKEKEIMTV